MSDILDTLVEFFKQEDWTCTPLEGQSVLQTQFQGENGSWTCYALAREEEAQFVFFSVCPVNAPDNQRSNLSEFITRANFGLMIGNFEMDWDDGEIRFKTGIDVEGDRLTIALVRQVVYANVLMLDMYLPGLLSVLYGQVTPATAIQAIDDAEG
jgi:hypothetical protein